MINHWLKQNPGMFQDMLDGKKTIEIRRRSDFNVGGGIAIGDQLCLQEFDAPSNSFTGRDLLVTVTWKSPMIGPGKDPDFVYFSVQLVKDPTPAPAPPPTPPRKSWIDRIIHMDLFSPGK